MFNVKKYLALETLRKRLSSGKNSIGGWMQIPNSSIAEIMASNGFQWITVDMEHGSIDTHQLPDIFRAIELCHALPFVRVSNAVVSECNKALEAGAVGLVLPMIESKSQLQEIVSGVSWPPSGNRGVGLSRANLYGSHFKEYNKFAQRPFIVAIIESKTGVDNLNEIIDVKGLDVIFVGPYDLSASLGKVGQFKNKDYMKCLNYVSSLTKKSKISLGIHVVEPNFREVREKIKQGYNFIAYSTDAIFLNRSSKIPKI